MSSEPSVEKEGDLFSMSHTDNLMYIVHFKDGTTRKIHEGEPGAPYPHQLDISTVTSIERVVNGVVYSIKNHPEIESFFVKTTVQDDMLVGGPGPKHKGTSTILERILGFELNGYKIELIINAKHNHCKLDIKKVVNK